MFNDPDLEIIIRSPSHPESSYVLRGVATITIDRTPDREIDVTTFGDPEPRFISVGGFSRVHLHASAFQLVQVGVDLAETPAEPSELRRFLIRGDES